MSLVHDHADKSGRGWGLNTGSAQGFSPHTASHCIYFDSQPSPSLSLPMTGLMIRWQMTASSG